MSLNLFAVLASRMAYPKYEPYDYKKYLISNNKTDTQCYIYEHDGLSVISFRGTQKNLKDILTDIWAFKRHIPFTHTKRIRVHRGFYRAYMSVRDEILDELITHKTDKVLITGHSLGGALATLCAVDIQKNDIYQTKDIYLKTFGSPKVGNRHFKKSFNKRIINSDRFVNPFDFVPTVPVFASHIGTKMALKGFKGHDINNYMANIKMM